MFLICSTPAGTVTGMHCSECAYWDASARGDRGLCRHGAPRTLLAGAEADFVARAVWPQTDASDWCVRIPTMSAGGSDFMSAPDSDRSRPGVALAFWLVGFSGTCGRGQAATARAAVFRRLSPCRRMRCALWTRRSRMASARVGSPTTS
jgi:hypothetical protein